jgi:hypothetical protein
MSRVVGTQGYKQTASLFASLDVPRRRLAAVAAAAVIAVSGAASCAFAFGKLTRPDLSRPSVSHREGLANFGRRVDDEAEECDCSALWSCISAGGQCSLLQAEMDSCLSASRAQKKSVPS